MRYVIVAASAGFFLAWDLIYNRGEYISDGVRMLNHAFRMIGLN